MDILLVAVDEVSLRSPVRFPSELRQSAPVRGLRWRHAPAPTAGCADRRGRRPARRDAVQRAGPGVDRLAGPAPRLPSPRRASRRESGRTFPRPARRASLRTAIWAIRRAWGPQRTPSSRPGSRSGCRPATSGSTSSTATRPLTTATSCPASTTSGPSRRGTRTGSASGRPSPRRRTPPSGTAGSRTPYGSPGDGAAWTRWTRPRTGSCWTGSPRPATGPARWSRPGTSPSFCARNSAYARHRRPARRMPDCAPPHPRHPAPNCSAVVRNYGS